MDIIVKEWERDRAENELLPEAQQKKLPALSEIVPHKWEGAAVGALQEAAEAYIIGMGFS